MIQDQITPRSIDGYKIFCLVVGRDGERAMKEYISLIKNEMYKLINHIKNISFQKTFTKNVEIHYILICVVYCGS